MRAQVDELFKRVWHYFDKIIVRDMFTPNLLQDPVAPREALINILLSHLPPLFYLREIGAESLVEFVAKSVCHEHWKRHAEEEGLGAAVDSRSSLTEQLRETAIFFFHDDAEGDPFYWIESPELSSRAGIRLKDYPDLDERGLQRLLVDLVFREHLTQLTGDIRVARHFKLPLGAVSHIHGRMLASAVPPTLADVVFSLNLPILDGVPTKSLIELRQQEHDAFVRFRSSLAKAVTEQVKQSGARDAQAVAEQIRLDVIEPSLAGIRQRLRASEKALANKAGVALFLGALATTCGVLGGLPPPLAVSGGAVATITAANVAVQRHIDERQQVSVDEMYFLWKAVEHSH